MKFMDALLKHVIKYPEPLVVPVYDYRILETKESEIYALDEYIYSYDMMRCGILTVQERGFINTVAAEYSFNYIDTFNKSADKLEAGRKEFPRLYSFLKQVVEQDRYWDIHSGNVMMDEDGEYVLIDLEGFVRTPLELSQNNWISRE
jgi:hypothetical protein